VASLRLHVAVTVVGAEVARSHDLWWRHAADVDVMSLAAAVVCKYGTSLQKWTSYTVNLSDAVTLGGAYETTEAELFQSVYRVTWFVAVGGRLAAAAEGRGRSADPWYVCV